MNIAPLKREIEQLAKDKGIDRDTIIGALEEAMKQAARKKFGFSCTTISGSIAMKTKVRGKYTFVPIEDD